MNRVISLIIVSFIFLLPMLSPVHAASHEKTDATKVDTTTAEKPEEKKKADDGDEEPDCD